jgi:hypothetical protein
MTKFCPKCNTQVYDDTSLFCYKCGTQLPVHIPEKKEDSSQNYGFIVPGEKSEHARHTSLVSSKSASIHPIKPIEICAQCGSPIIYNNRIFCKNCGAYVREVPSSDIPSIVKQETKLIKETSTPSNPKANKLRFIVIIAGLVILVIVVLILVFSHTYPASGECIGAETCNPTGNPLGGGVGYNDIYTANSAGITNISTNREQFIAALRAATPGSVIFIPATASINLTGLYGNTIKIPEGVTIAGDRGHNGSAGGRIFQNRIAADPTGSDVPTHSMLMPSGNNVRVTGLRLEGPDKTTLSMSALGAKVGIALENYKGLEVDNCEIFGWSSSGVYVNIDNPAVAAGGLTSPEIGSGIANIHHNYIHHCQSDGLGYGVEVDYGSALIKGNVFGYTRHSVAASGMAGDGYEASYNVQIANSTEHTFDVHGYPNDGDPAGTLFSIHHNTIKTSGGSGVGIRGAPRQGATITLNELRYCEGNCYGGPHNKYGALNAVFQYGTGNMTMTKNNIDGEYSAVGPVYDSSS